MIASAIIAATYFSSPKHQDKERAESSIVSRVDAHLNRQTFSPPPPPPPSGVVSVRINAGEDDAEQNLSTGTVDIVSTDMELAVDGAASQLVGLRFNNIQIPKGATITSAYVEFETDVAWSTACNLTIKGQASDNPAAFTATSNNISARPQTTASVAWSPAAWATVDQKQQSPSLNSIIQEIVNRSGWLNGNSIAILVQGTGTREAESFEGEATAAPLLVVTYTASEICNNSLDDDGDGLTDCADPDCAGSHASCLSECLGTNLGFESGLSSWSSYGAPVASSAQAHSGTQSAFFANNNDYLYQNITTGITANSQYVVSFWHRGTAAAGGWRGMVLKFKDAGGYELSRLELPIGDASSWTLYERIFTMPTSVTNVELVFATYGSSIATYVDDICLNPSAGILPTSTCTGTKIYSGYQDWASKFWFNNGTGWLSYDWDSDVQLCNNGNGTLTLQGNATGSFSEGGTDCGSLGGWYINATLSDKKTWAQFGGNYDNHSYTDNGCPDRHTEWDYWNISGTITGTGCNSGKVFPIIGNAPGYRIQVGYGANRNTCGYGLAGWIDYNDNGTSRQADFYVSLPKDAYSPLEIRDNNVDEDSDGLVDCADPDISSTGYAALSAGDLGDTDGRWAIHGKPDGSFAGLYELTDRLKVDLGRRLSVGNQYILTWRRKNSYSNTATADMIVEESADGITWTQRPTNVTTSEKSLWVSTTLSANVVTRYLRFRQATDTDDDFELDAITLLACSSTEICGNGLDDDGDGLSDSADPQCSYNCCTNLLQNGSMEMFNPSFTFATPFEGVTAQKVNSLAVDNNLAIGWGAAAGVSSDFWLLRDWTNTINNPDGNYFAYFQNQNACAQVCGFTVGCNMAPLLCQPWQNGDVYEFCFKAAAWKENMTSGLPAGAGTQANSIIGIDVDYTGFPQGVIGPDFSLPASSSFANLNWQTICVKFTYNSAKPVKSLYISARDNNGVVVDDVTLRNLSDCGEVCNNGTDDDGDGLVDCADSGCNKIYNGEFDSWSSNWVLYNQAGNTATHTVATTSQLSGANSGFVDITTATGTDWHIQYLQPGLTTNAGDRYTLTFMAKAAATRPMRVMLQRTNSPYTTYWNQTVNLTTAPQAYSFDFQIDSTNVDNVGLYFNLGASTSNVYIDKVSLTKICSEFCSNGLDDDGDAQSDCSDSDCKPVISNIITDCQPTNADINLTVTGKNTPFGYRWSDMATEALWQFNNSTTDGSGFGHNQTSLTGTASYDAKDKIEGSHSFVFNGSTSIRYGSDGGFLESGYSARTYSFWIKPANLTGIKILFEQGGSTAGLAARLNGNILTAAFRTGGSTTQKTTGNLTFPNDGAWHHVAVVYNAGTITCYLDGTASTSGSGNATIPADANNDAIGQRNGTDAFGSSANNFYSGKMDDVRLYYSALPANKIADLARNDGDRLNLSGGTYTVTVTNSTGCSTTSSIAFSSPCTEYCNNGQDDDLDGLTDCTDTDCNKITLSALAVSACINQPLQDIATVNLNVAWTTPPANDEIVVSIYGKKRYISTGSTAGNQNITFNVPADGSTNNNITAYWKNSPSLCNATTTFNAPVACSANTIACNILYLCGQDKPWDGDAWDHGFIEYLDMVNGSKTVTPILTKADATGYGTYDPINPSTFVTVDFNNYDLIVISATTEGHVASDLVSLLKDSPKSIINANYPIVNDLGMSATEAGYQFQSNAYTDNTTSKLIYDYHTINPYYGKVFTNANVIAGGTGLLWTNPNDMTPNTNSIIFSYDATDALPGVGSAHGVRVYLGYHMNGVYVGTETGYVLPAPVETYLSPAKHFTADGKYYFDQAILAAAAGCIQIENCSNGIDDDNDILADAADPECPGVSNPSANNSCSVKPFIFVPCYVDGNPLAAGTAATKDAFVMVPYDATGTAMVPGEKVLANFGAIGATWGVAIEASSKTVFTSSVLKRHVGLGSINGTISTTGGIYAFNNNLSLVKYIDVNTIGINTGTDPRNGTPANSLSGDVGTPSYDVNAYNLVGKVGIGDMDYDAVHDVLWFINLYDRSLYGIKNVDVNTSPTAANILGPYPVPDPGCSSGVNDVRPWGLGIKDGKVYVGAVCSAETTQNVPDLHAYIFEFDPNLPGNGLQNFYNFDLNYERGNVGYYLTDEGDWLPWQTSANAMSTLSMKHQPILSDIEFDVDGSMIIGLMDRVGMQSGYNNYLPDNSLSNTTLFKPYAVGDVIRVCYVSGAYVMQGGAGCSLKQTCAADGRYCGPGGGEYYIGDFGGAASNQFAESAFGSLALLPGTGEVAFTQFDPYNPDFEGGFGFLNNTTGAANRRFRVYDGGSFGKAVGLGDIEIGCVNEICANSYDDDGDGLVDESCSASEICANGIDDDGDGLVDCGDPECAPCTTVPCENGVKVTSQKTATATGSGAVGTPSLANFFVPAGNKRAILVLANFEREHCQSGDNCTSTNSTGTGLGDNFASPNYVSSGAVPQITVNFSGTGGNINKQNPLTLPAGDLRFLNQTGFPTPPGTSSAAYHSRESYFVALYESDIQAILGGATSGNINITLPDVVSPKDNADDAILLAYTFVNVDQTATGIVRSGANTSGPFDISNTSGGVPGNFTVSMADLDNGQEPDEPTDGLFLFGVSGLGQPTDNGGFLTASGFVELNEVTTNNSNGDFVTFNEADGFSVSAQFRNGTSSGIINTASIQSAASSSLTTNGGMTAIFTIESAACSEICTNGIDDDSDGLVDCNDPDCGLFTDGGDIGSNETDCEPYDPSLINSISPANGTLTMEYKWQVSTDANNWTDIAGANGLTYNPAPITTTTYFRRAARSTSGACAIWVYSNTVVKAVENPTEQLLLVDPGRIAFIVNNVTNDFILTDEYVVHKIDLTFQNNSTDTIRKVSFAVPFSWGGFTNSSSPTFAYEWESDNNRWMNYSMDGADPFPGVLHFVADTGNSGTYPQQPPLAGRIGMDRTNMPLTQSNFGITATVQANDRVPIWYIDDVMNPGEAVSFTLYFQQEKLTPTGPTEYWWHYIWGYILSERNTIDFEACELGATGTGCFDLSIPNGWLDNVPATVDITYHATETDAENGTNSLSSPHVSAAGFIYARLEEPGSGCFDVVPVLLRVGPPCSENCTNGLDDDGDGLVDTADPDCPSCATAADCPTNQMVNASFEDGTPVGTMGTVGGSVAFYDNATNNPVSNWNVSSGWWVDAASNSGTGSVDGCKLMWLDGTPTGSTLNCFQQGYPSIGMSTGNCYTICAKVAAFDPTNLAHGTNASFDFGYITSTTGWVINPVTPGGTVNTWADGFNVSWNLPAPTAPKTITGAAYTGAVGQVLDWKTLNWTEICVQVTPASSDNSLTLAVSQDQINTPYGLAIDDVSMCTGCVVENCTNGIDDDGDGLVDCDDPDCNLITNGEFNSGTTDWLLHVQAGNTATLSVANTSQLSGLNSGHIDLTTASGTEWEVQLAQHGKSIVAGQSYTVSFQAKAAANRNASVMLQRTTSPYNSYWYQTFALTTSPQSYSYTFVVDSTNTGLVGLYFNLAASNTDVWIDKVQFTRSCVSSEVCGNGIDDDADGSIDSNDNECFSCTDGILTNPDFNSNLADWTDWGNTTIVTQPSGNRYAHVAGGYGGFGRDYPGTPGTTYSLSFKARATTGEPARSGFRFFDIGYNQLGYEYQYTISSTNFNQYQVAAVAPPNTAYVQVFAWKDEGAGTADFDGYCLKLTTENCSNGTDDDGDGLNNCADPDCPCANMLAVGNMVYIDADKDKAMDVGEGVDGVQLKLFYQGNDPFMATPVATATTANGGKYLFDNLIPGNYFIHIPKTEFASGKPLFGKVSVDGNDGDYGTDDQLSENGSDNPDPSTLGLRSSVFILNYNLEPINSGTELGFDNTSDDTSDASDDNNTDLTIDFGFANPAPCSMTISQAKATPCYKNSSGNWVTDIEVTVYWTGFIDGDTIQVSMNGVSDQFAPFNEYGGVIENGTQHFFLRGIPAAGGTGTVTAQFRVRQGCAATKSVALPDCVCPAGAVSGVAWQDFNNNGTQDSHESAGVAGLTVLAYDCEGILVGTTTTNASGAFSFAGLTNGDKYRIEFSNIPAPYVPTEMGLSNGSNVQFVTAPTCHVDYGVNNPDLYCHENPLAGVPCYVNGLAASPAVSGHDAFVVFPYQATAEFDPYAPNQVMRSVPPTHASNVGETGSTWGVAYQRSTQTLFTSAVIRRHVGLGPLGTGGIYKINMTNPGAPVASNWIDVKTLGVDTGTDPRDGTPGNTLPPATDQPSYDLNAYNAVGKKAIGDIDYDEPRNTLWFVNLYERTLVGIKNVNPSAAPSAADVLEYPIAIPAGYSCGATHEFRPWGLKVHEGKVYIGVICTNIGASVWDPAGLKAFVVSFDPSNPASGFSYVTEIDLTYDKFQYGTFKYNNWVKDYTDLAGGLGVTSPILSDIEFDTDGSLVLGIADRLGLQSGYYNYAPDPSLTDQVLYTTAQSGDILRLCKVGNNYVLPGSDPACPLLSEVHGDGINGGEYYWGDWGPKELESHSMDNGFNETAMGGIALKKGSGEVLSTQTDAIVFRSGAIATYNNVTGGVTKSYTLYVGIENGAQGKATGLGDIEVMCNYQPIEIGNYVWLDEDDDGVQDACEHGLDSVVVSLYKTNGLLIGQTKTDAAGNYVFNENNVDTLGFLNDNIWTGLSANANYVIVVGNVSNNGVVFANGKLRVNGIDALLTFPNIGEGANPDLNDSDGTILSGLFFAANGFPGVVTKTPAKGSLHNQDFGFRPLCEDFNVFAGTDVTICIGSSTTLTATGYGGLQPHTFNWSNGLGSGESKLVSPVATTTYTVTITDADGCTKTDQVTVTVINCTEACGDGIDNDGDGQVDCADPDCAIVGQPNLVDDTYTTCPSLVFQEQPIFNDGNIQFPVYSIYTAATKGTVTINTHGVFTYTPYNSACGVDSFKYQVCNALTGCCDWATVKLQVGDNLPPTLQNLPADITIACGEPIPPAPTVIGLDACPGIYITFDETSNQGSAGSCQNYQITRTWTAYDKCGNYAVGTQKITVADEVEPEIFRVYTLGNGKKMLAGVAQKVKTGWTRVKFPIAFDNPPLVFAQSVTANGSEPITIRVKEVDEEGFFVKVQEQEQADGVHAIEEIAWMATEVGVLTNESKLQIGLINSVTNAQSTVNYVNPFTAEPVLLATGMTHNEADPFSIRFPSQAINNFKLYLDEEQSSDAEKTHLAESVAWLAMNAGSLTDIDGGFIGHAGKVTVGNTWTTVNLPKRFSKPVVLFGGQPTANDPATIRVRNVTPTSFEVRIEEWQYTDNAFTARPLSYLVVEGSLPPLVGSPCSQSQVSLLPGINIFAVDDCDNQVTIDYTESTTLTTAGLVYEHIWVAADDCGNANTVVRNDTCDMAAVRVKAFLGGALIGINDVPTMRDNLRAKHFIPSASPYWQATATGAGAANYEGIPESYYNVTGPNAMVDWVLIELRDPVEPSKVVGAKSALLLRNGTVINPNGTETIVFDTTSAGNYYVSIKHRNHLGVMTGVPMFLDAETIPLVDFTSSSLQLYGNEHTQRLLDGTRRLWSGDLNGDGKVIYQGPVNDAFKLFHDIMTHPDNTEILANFIRSGYEPTDVNLDGNAIYQGPQNDRAMLLTNTILVHPANSLVLANFIAYSLIP